MESELESLLSTERQRLEAEQTQLQVKLVEARERLVAVQQRLEHVRALLGENEAPGASLDARQERYKSPNGNTSHVCDIAEVVLNERSSQPMYYKELAKEVIRRGGTLNGPTPWANLTARMVLDPRFVRPTAKGFYALRRDYPNARNVGARKQRRSRAS